MRVRVLQHVPFEDVGSIRQWLENRSALVLTDRLYEQPALLDHEDPARQSFDWLIVMGGPMGVNDERSHPWLAAEKRLIARAVREGRVVLGICLGAQLIASALGARVYTNRQKEIGWFPIWKPESKALPAIARLIPDGMPVYHWHGDTFDLPPNASRVAYSKACDNQAFTIGDRVLGLQFHLETTPAAAAALIASCRRELVPGPGIQSEPEMLERPERFHAINRLMESLLDFLAELSAS